MKETEKKERKKEKNKECVHDDDTPLTLSNSRKKLALGKSCSDLCDFWRRYLGVHLTLIWSSFYPSPYLFFLFSPSSGYVTLYSTL